MKEVLTSFLPVRVYALDTHAYLIRWWYHRWDRGHYSSVRQARCVGIITAARPGNFTVPCGAAIARRGLSDTASDPRDHLERFAWEHARKLLGSDGLSVPHSQCYGRRFSERVRYVDGRNYFSAPTTGLIADTSDVVVKVSALW
jgi:hypothetical protein